MDMKYSLPGLTAIDQGARLDARMRFALELMKAPSFLMNSAEWGPDETATYAFNLAEAAFAEGEKRGWIKELSTEPTLSATETAHGRRQATLQVIAQIHAQKEAQTLATRSPVLMPRNQ